MLVSFIGMIAVPYAFIRHMYTVFADPLAFSVGAVTVIVIVMLLLIAISIRVTVWEITVAESDHRETLSAVVAGPKVTGMKDGYDQSSVGAVAAAARYVFQLVVGNLSACGAQLFKIYTCFFLGKLYSVFLCQSEELIAAFCFFCLFNYFGCKVFHKQFSFFIRGQRFPFLLSFIRMIAKPKSFFV